tara:strand:+ start:211 stop:480 length:270 start_codon:yes stop_codon:yes gene_type:complete
MKTKTMKEAKELAQEMYNEIWHIYTEYSGYDYNDTMWCQAVGSEESWNDAIHDNDWESLIKEYTPCLEYMRHIKKIRILQESMPSEVYC